MRITALRKPDLVAQNRFQHRHCGIRFHSQALPRIGPGKSRRRADGSRRRFLKSFIFSSGIQADLIHLLLPGLCLFLPPRKRLPTAFLSACKGKIDLDLQASPCDFHISKAVSLSVSGYFEYFGSEFFRIYLFSCILLKSAEKFFHALHFQGGTEITGEQFPLPDQFRHSVLIYFPGFQIGFHQRLVTEGNIFHPFFPVRIRAEINAVLIQSFFQVRKDPVPVRTLLVHFVDKKEYRDLIPFQKFPQCHGMALHSVHTADHQNRVVQHLQRTFHFRGEIHMSRRIQKGDLHTRGTQNRLFGKNSDASFFFQFVCVQKGVSVIHAPQFPDLAAEIEKSLRKSCFTRVHVGEYPRAYMF